MLTDYLLAPQAGGLLLLVGRNVELGVSLQERTAIRAQRLVGEFLLDRGGVRSLADLGNQERHRGRDFGFPFRLDPRGVQFALLGPEVEPARSHVGTIQGDEWITTLDVLTEKGMDLADHTSGAGPDIDPAIRIDLDPARDPELDRQLVIAGLCRSQLRGLELCFTQHDGGRRVRCRDLLREWSLSFLDSS